MPTPAMEDDPVGSEPKLDPTHDVKLRADNSKSCDESVNESNTSAIASEDRCNSEPTPKPNASNADAEPSYQKNSLNQPVSSSYLHSHPYSYPTYPYPTQHPHPHPFPSGNRAAMAATSIDVNPLQARQASTYTSAIQHPPNNNHPSFNHTMQQQLPPSSSSSRQLMHPVNNPAYPNESLAYAYQPTSSYTHPYHQYRQQHGIVSYQPQAQSSNMYHQRQIPMTFSNHANQGMRAAEFYAHTNDGTLNTSTTALTSQGYHAPTGYPQSLQLQQNLPPSYASKMLKFPELLYKMLMESDLLQFTSVMSWLPHGRAFIVKDVVKFEILVMPKYFPSSKWKSFRRQLNLYECYRIGRGKDRGGYFHPCLLRGRPDLLSGMKRVKLKGDNNKAGKVPVDEAIDPDFYNMKPISPSLPSAPVGATPISSTSVIVKASDDDIRRDATSNNEHNNSSDTEDVNI